MQKNILGSASGTFVYVPANSVKLEKNCKLAIKTRIKY